MPYKRKGKCVYKENTDGSLGDKVGCSDTIEEAKAHLKALYANVPDASKEAGATPSPYSAHGPGGVVSAPGQISPKKKKKVTNAMLTPKEFKSKFKVSEKDFNYAQQETWVVDSASQAFAYLMSTARQEMYQGEQADTKELVAMLKSLSSFISDQLDEMDTALDSSAVDSLFAYKETAKDSTWVITKEGNNYRWTIITGSAFEDRDGEIISEKALLDDCDRMELTGDYGELLWWHCDGEIHPERGEKEARPYIPIGLCDTSFVYEKCNIESGIFYDTEIGKTLTEKSAKYGASKQFFYLPEEPIEGAFSYIRTKERSLLPRGKESNLLTKLFGQPKEKEMANNDERIAGWGKAVDAKTKEEALASAKAMAEKAATFLKSKESAKMSKKKDDKEDAADGSDDEAAEGETKKGKEVVLELQGSKELVATLTAMKEANETAVKELKETFQTAVKGLTDTHSKEVQELKTELAQTQLNVAALLGIQPKTNLHAASESKENKVVLTPEQLKMAKEAEGEVSQGLENWIISGTRLAA